MTSHPAQSRSRTTGIIRGCLLLLAVGFVSGAGAWAGGTIRSSDIVDNTIRGRDIHASAVAASDIKSGGVTAAKLNPSAVSAALPRTIMATSTSSVAVPNGATVTVAQVTVRAPARRRYSVDGLILLSDTLEAYRASCGFSYDGNAHSGLYVQGVPTTAQRPQDHYTMRDVSEKLAPGLHTITFDCTGLLGAHMTAVYAEMRVTEVGARLIPST